MTASPGPIEGTGRVGRRPGRPDTRAAILDAARSAFAVDGFAGASVRRIAAAAGVDPALVHHYFRSKRDLFLRTVQVPVDVERLVATIVRGDADDLGERLVRTVLTTWDSPVGVPLLAAVRSALADEAMARVLREFLVGEVVGRVLRAVGVPDEEREVRTALVASQMVGLVVGRYVLRVPPLADLPVDVLAPQVGATVQRYLTAPLAPLSRASNCLTG